MKILLPRLCLLLGLQANPLAANASYDFENSNAAIEVVIPTFAPISFQEFSQSAGNATLVLRITTVVTKPWYDASAPYHSTAVRVYSSLRRRPAWESATNANTNISLRYGSHRVLNDSLPAQAPLSSS